MSTWAAMAAAANKAPAPAQPDTSESSEAAAASTSTAAEHAATDASEPAVRTKKPRIETLILDAGALIMRAPLDGLASEYYIPPRVIQEIKHASAREYLDSLRLRPDFKLNIVQPGPASMVAVSEFAKKTGDIGVLSTQDLEVIALTYEQEVHRHGTKRIRSRPDGPRGEAASTSSSASATANGAEDNAAASTSASTSADTKAARQAAIEKKRQQKADAKQKKLEEEAAAQGLTVDQLVAQRIQQNREKKAAKKHAKAVAAEEAAAPLDDAAGSAEQNAVQEASTSHVQPGPEQGWHDADYTDDDEEEGEGEGEWITPDNVQKAKNFSLGFVDDSRMPGWKYSVDEAKDDVPEPADLIQPEEPLDEGWERVESSSKAKSKSAFKSGHVSRDYNDPSIQSRPSLSWDAMGNVSNTGHMTVACITGDFAVQNVLLQMGLSLVGVHGSRVRSVKSFVLRCHACMKVCKDMEKKFCPVCGNATLTKVAVTVDDTAKGGFQLHLKKNYRFNLRGTKYSIPAPKAGSASGGKTGGSGIILREDQLEWQRALAKEASRKRKEERALEKAMRAGKDSLSVRYEEAWDTGDIFLGSQFASRDKSSLPVIGHGRKNPNANRRTRK
jgi:RNA-binding protein NOB1